MVGSIITHLVHIRNPIAVFHDLTILISNYFPSGEQRLQNRPAPGQGRSLPEHAENFEQGNYPLRFGLRRWLQAL